MPVSTISQLYRGSQFYGNLWHSHRLYINIVEEESRIKSPILFSYFPEFYGFKDFSEGSVVSMVREEEQTLTMVTKISDFFQL
jgi:hypothetical protein